MSTMLHLQAMASKLDPPAPASPSTSSSTPGGAEPVDTWEYLDVATKLVHGRTSVKDPYNASSPPLWQTATFAQPGGGFFA